MIQMMMVFVMRMRLRVVKDATACNYNASATDDDGSCVLLMDICKTCSEDGLSVVDNDADDDGVCDDDEVVGCKMKQHVILIISN